MRSKAVSPTGRGLWSRLGKYDNRTPDGWAKRPLQDFETLYIGVVTPAVRRAFVGYHRAESRLMRDCEGSLTTTMARIVLRYFGSGQWNKHEVER